MGQSTSVDANEHTKGSHLGLSPSIAPLWDALPTASFGDLDGEAQPPSCRNNLLEYMKFVDRYLIQTLLLTRRDLW